MTYPSREENVLDEGGGGVGGQNRVDLSFCVFPCFAVFGGLKISRCWEKQHEKCHCHTPSCVPQMLVKTRI